MSTEPSERQSVFATRGPLIVAVGATIGGLLLLIVFAVLLLRGDREDGSPTPTPFPQAPVADVRQEALVVGVSNSETISVSLDVPASLAIAGTTYRLQPQTILADGIWTPNLTEDGQGVWIYGTVINYVIGLRDSSANRALLESLAPGDVITLRTQTNASLDFVFDAREVVSAANRDVYAQTAPGITIVLLGTAGSDRLMVHGRYVVNNAASPFLPGGQTGGGGMVELGETAQLGNLQLTVLEVSYLYDRPEAPAGFAFYLVNYEVQNVGQVAVDSNLLRLTLVDEVGNQYALNPVASQLGNNRQLAGPIPPGQPLLATAGYQVPTGLSNANLRWLVTRTDDGSQIQVNIPFSGGSTAGGEGVTVSLQQADVSLDGTSLMLSGQIANFGAQSVVIAEPQVTLNSEGTIYLKLSTNPGFPWVVSPGQTLPFVVTFQRPFGSSAIFQVLNQPFALEGLR